MEVNRRCCVQCDNGGRGSLDEWPVRSPDLILWPQPDGTARTIEADAMRALVGYIERRDGGS